MSKNDIILNVKVIPQAKSNKIDNVTLDEQGSINVKARVTAPASEGKANEALIKLLAGYYNLSKSSFSIKSGWSSRNKLIAVHNATRDVLLKGAQGNLGL